jgi:hypothetical protein
MDNHRRDRSEFYAQYKAGSDLCKISSHRWIDLSCHHSQDSRKNQNPNSRNPNSHSNQGWGKIDSGSYKNWTAAISHGQRPLQMNSGSFKIDSGTLSRSLSLQTSYSTFKTGSWYPQQATVLNNRSRLPFEQVTAPFGQDSSKSLHQKARTVTILNWGRKQQDTPR